MPKRKTWRCFFCNEVFHSEKYAAEHFGGLEGTAACKIKGHEGHLLTALRRAEAELRTYRDEDTELHRTIAALLSEKDVAVQRAEEIGYARGLRDAGYAEDN